ncbi:MAG: hypothetical protein IJP07_07910 [Firmicutes bacterium]|nr:hypothetical protein [Bacillota bacterium]
MPNYRKLYFYLFNAMTDALNEIEACNYGRAKNLLLRAQILAEENVIDADSDALPPKPTAE